MKQSELIDLFTRQTVPLIALLRVADNSMKELLLQMELYNICLNRGTLEDVNRVNDYASDNLTGVPRIKLLRSVGIATSIIAEIHRVGV